MREAEKFVAAKPFNTANRRIAQGEVVTQEEIRAGDRDPELLKQQGLLVGYDTKAADKAARKAMEADGLVLADQPDPVPAPAAGDPAPQETEPAEPTLKRPSRRS